MTVQQGHTTLHTHAPTTIMLLRKRFPTEHFLLVVSRGLKVGIQTKKRSISAVRELEDHLARLLGWGDVLLGSFSVLLRSLPRHVLKPPTALRTSLTEFHLATALRNWAATLNALLGSPQCNDLIVSYNYWKPNLHSQIKPFRDIPSSLLTQTESSSPKKKTILKMA